MKTALQNTNVMFSSTEQDLIKQTEKSLKKVGVKQYERIVLYFTPALSVVTNSIVRNFKVNDNDLMERLRWVVGHVVRVSGSEPVAKGKLLRQIPSPQQVGYQVTLLVRQVHQTQRVQVERLETRLVDWWQELSVN